MIYCSLKGFLRGPYENRTALDEMVQMMGGLAFMTGLPGKPMRAGASVNDIMGAMFGVIAIQGAVRERETHRARPGGPGRAVREQRVPDGAGDARRSDTGEPSEPWSVKERPWPVYDLFDTGRDEAVLRPGRRRPVEGLLRRVRPPEWLTDPRLRPTRTAPPRGRGCCRSSRR